MKLKNYVDNYIENKPNARQKDLADSWNRKFRTHISACKFTPLSDPSIIVEYFELNGFQFKYNQIFQSWKIKVKSVRYVCINDIEELYNTIIKYIPERIDEFEL